MRQAGVIETGEPRLSWQPGQASALDTAEIASGSNFGNVIVGQRTPEGWKDITYRIDLACAFHAFFPDGPIHVE